MSLDDLVPEEDEYAVGTVSSRMKPENITMKRDWWVHHIALHSPSAFRWRLKSVSREQVKLFVEMLDEVIEGRVDGVKVSDKEKERAEKVREELVEHL